MQLQAGKRLKSVTCSTEVMVVKAPKTDDIDLRCGGKPMSETGEPKEQVDPKFAEGTQLGKRYDFGGGDIELLAIKAGEGTLSIGDDPLELKSAKPLPASD
jgi:hypothetical protein